MADAKQVSVSITLEVDDAERGQTYRVKLDTNSTSFGNLLDREQNEWQKRQAEDDRKRDLEYKRANQPQTKKPKKDSNKKK